MERTITLLKSNRFSWYTADFRLGMWFGGCLLAAWLVCGVCEWSALHRSSMLKSDVASEPIESVRRVSIKDERRLREIGACLDRIDADLKVLTIDSPWRR